MDPSPAPMQADGRRRLAAVALELFERQGFDATTADQLAEAGGVSRRTFFRYFPTKEDVLFADHAEALERLGELLERDDPQPVRCAARAVATLLDAVGDEHAVRRARLIRATPALRDRETVRQSEVQRRVGDYLAARERDPRRVMFAQVVAAALIAALREVLASWQDAEGGVDPQPLFAELADEIVESMGSSPAPSGRGAAEVVVVATGLSPTQIARLIEGA